MAIDTGPLLIKLAAWAEELEAEFGGTAELTDAMLVVEIRTTRPCPTTSATTARSYVDFRVLSGRDVVARGLHDRMKMILG